MKKPLLIGIGVIALIGGTIWAYSSLVPTRLEIQSHDYRVSLNNLKEAEKKLDELKRIETKDFCLLQDIKHIEGMDIPKLDETRYIESCDRIGMNNYKKMPSEKNSNGEFFPDVIIPVGSSHKEKVRDLVAKNCIPEILEVFDEVYDYAEENGIRGEMPFVISMADSQCGKHMSTPNNPGNVHNNDRGNRVGFFTMQEGMEAIVNTLNNKYIKGIKTIGHLSQGGRNIIGSDFDCSNAPAPYKCYASSPENWNANVMRAMRALYPDAKEYMLFRIKQNDNK